MIHRENVEALRAELEKLIVGQVKPGWSCCGGDVEKPESKALSVAPPGVYVRGGGAADEYQIDLPLLWVADMENGWSLGVTNFIPEEIVDEMFERHRPLYTPGTAAAV